MSILNHPNVPQVLQAACRAVAEAVAVARAEVIDARFGGCSGDNFEATEAARAGLDAAETALDKLLQRAVAWVHNPEVQRDVEAWEARQAAAKAKRIEAKTDAAVAAFARRTGIKQI